jgi:hypothetical protein
MKKHDMPDSLTRVPLKTEDATVSVVINVNGLFVWKLMYVAEDATYFRGTKHPKGNTIFLGNAAELLGDLDSWKLTIASPDQDLEGSARLAWLEEGQEKASWEVDLSTKQPVRGGNAFYIKG